MNPISSLYFTPELLTFTQEIFMFTHGLYHFPASLLNQLILFNPLSSICFTNDILVFLQDILKLALDFKPFTWPTFRSDVPKDSSCGSMCFTHDLLTISPRHFEVGQ